LVSEIPHPQRQGLHSRKGNGSSPDADVKTPGPLIDVCRTYILVIIRKQIGIPRESVRSYRFPVQTAFDDPKDHPRELIRLSCTYHCFYVVEPRKVQGRISHEELLMCVAVPAEVIEIKEGNIGLVDYGDLRQEVRLDLVDVKVGEFVLVHVGFAIQRLSREDGLETREIFRQVYEALDS